MPPHPVTEAHSSSLEPDRPSQSGPDEPIRDIPAGWPARCTRQTSDVKRQTSDAHHRLMTPPSGAGHNNKPGHHVAYISARFAALAFYLRVDWLPFLIFLF